MKFNRTKNATRNLMWGIVNKFVGLVLPFVCRWAIIREFGANYLGLNSLFTSILNTLNLTELGFGTAVVFFLYKAVAENDNEKICALMNYYKKIYRIIGIIVTVIGLSLMPFLNVFVKSDIPAGINIYIIYLITLSSTSITYFLFAYRNCLFHAYQRSDITLNINSVLMIIERILQLYFIFGLKNYYLYIGCVTLTNISNNICVAIYSKKHFPQFSAKGALKKEEKHAIGQKVYGLFCYKIGNVIIGSADNIVLSSFLGLTITGLFGNYYYVVTLLFSFLGIYYNSIRSGLGNSIFTETKEKNYSDFKVLQSLQNWLVSWCTVCLLCLFDDYIMIMAGEEGKFPLPVVCCFCLYFFVWKIQDVVNIYKEAAGMWNYDKFRVIISALVNLVLNIITVQFIGVYGIILSTVFALTFIDIPWASRTLFKMYFDIKRTEYFISLLLTAVQTVVMCAVTFFICSLLHINNHWLSLIAKGIICVVVPNVIFIAFNFKNPSFKGVIVKLKQILKLKHA